MKKLRSGLQFRVYDLGNGKVEKIPKTTFQMCLTDLIWEPYLIFAPWILAKNVGRAKRNRESSINYFKKNKSSLLANLEITDEGIYQAKVTPLREIIGKDIEGSKKIIDSYANFVLDCWGEGFADKVYSFLQNNGIDNQGNIVLMDFAETDLDKDSVKKDILNKKWKKAADYRFRIHGKIKQYYKQGMEKTLTLTNLDKYWGKNKKT